jgi:hypothetical protein
VHRRCACATTQTLIEQLLLAIYLQRPDLSLSGFATLLATKGLGKLGVSIVEFCLECALVGRSLATAATTSPRRGPAAAPATADGIVPLSQTEFVARLRRIAASIDAVLQQQQQKTVLTADVLGAVQRNSTRCSKLIESETRPLRQLLLKPRPPPRRPTGAAAAAAAAHPPMTPPSFSSLSTPMVSPRLRRCMSASATRRSPSLRLLRQQAKKPALSPAAESKQQQQQQSLVSPRSIYAAARAQVKSSSSSSGGGGGSRPRRRRHRPYADDAVLSAKAHDATLVRSARKRLHLPSI